VHLARQARKVAAVCAHNLVDYAEWAGITALPISVLPAHVLAPAYWIDGYSGSSCMMLGSYDRRQVELLPVQHTPIRRTGLLVTVKLR
jgi:hypothetical protein